MAMGNVEVVISLKFRESCATEDRCVVFYLVAR